MYACDRAHVMVIYIYIYARTHARTHTSSPMLWKYFNIYSNLISSLKGKELRKKHCLTVLSWCCFVK